MSHLDLVTSYLLIKLGILLFCLYLFHVCPVYYPLFFVFGCCDTAFVGHLSVDSARQ